MPCPIQEEDVCNIDSIPNTNSDLVYVSYKFDSNIILTDDLTFGTKRLLEVDNRLILPVNTNIRFLITASDVLHS